MKKSSLIKNEKYWACLFTRLGIGFTFLYAAISSFLNPTSWVGFFPGFLINIFSIKILTVFSFYEIFLALWLFSNKKIFYAAILSALTTLGIVVFNFGAMDIVFRDVAIFFSAIALAILTKDTRK